MRKTYITKIPDKAGAFLKASQIISSQNGNIVRVNYNKAIDLHTMFIEVSATEENHKKIKSELEKCNYLFNTTDNQKILIIVLKLQDIPGSVTPVLEILKKYKINISYMSSQENGTDYQYFKMGLLIENTQEIKNLIDEISKICEISILDYEVTDRLLDGTVFYISFANEMRNILKLNQKQTNTVLVNANSLMQVLDEQKKSPLKTFDYIRRFAKFVQDFKNEKFTCNISTIDLSADFLSMNNVTDQKIIEEKVLLHTIEPPCGSNTYILETEDTLIFVDSGFTCYKEEMKNILSELIPNFKQKTKYSFITHADVDHIGLLDVFDKNYMSKNCYENFELEKNNQKGFREQNLAHEPYCVLSKIISEYQIPEISKCEYIENKNLDLSEEDFEIINQIDKTLFTYLGSVHIANWDFLLFEGNGGHIKGETIIICEKLNLVFTGDILVNIKGFSPEQKQFNAIAPFLMTGVDENPDMAKQERQYLKDFFENYIICPGHGALICQF